jgi:hypothetical protein
MTGISLHMQWPLTSQLHGTVSQREHLAFCYGSNSTPLALDKITKMETIASETKVFFALGCPGGRHGFRIDDHGIS